MRTRESILNMVPTSNNVLIQVDRKQDEYKLRDGTKIYLDCSFQPEQHAPVTGHVVSICKKLIFNFQPGHSSLKWDTDIQIQVGDYVISYYLAALNAFMNGRFISDQYNNQYLILKYDQLFAAKRGDQIITINGYNLLTPVKDIEQKGLRERMKKLGLLVPDSIRDTKKVAMGRLKYAADPIRRYRDPAYRDFYDEIKIGDVLLLRRNTDIPLEYDYHASLEGKQVFYRVQRNHMFAIIDESILN